MTETKQTPRRNKTDLEWTPTKGHDHDQTNQDRGTWPDKGKKTKQWKAAKRLQKAIFHGFRGELVIRNGASTFRPQAGVHVHPSQVQEHPAQVQIMVKERNLPGQREGINYLALSGWSAGSEMGGAPNRSCGLKATEWWIHRCQHWGWYPDWLKWSKSLIWNRHEGGQKKTGTDGFQNLGTDWTNGHYKLKWKKKKQKMKLEQNVSTDDDKYCLQIIPNTVFAFSSNQTRRFYYGNENASLPSIISNRFIKLILT